MKCTFFNKPLEWNLETIGESWKQGDTIKGIVKVKNHGTEEHSLSSSGVALAFAEIKKVQTRVPGALSPELSSLMTESTLRPGSELEMEFNFPISSNGAITDKKASYYLSFGKDFTEGQLQVKVEPHSLFSKIIGLLDTFYRFKQKDFKSTKSGVEFKLLPPTSRDMANIDSLLLTFSLNESVLVMNFNFQVKRLDTSTSKTKINKEKVLVEKTLGPKEYSLGKDMINQDYLLKTIEAVLSEIKIKALF